MFLKYEDYLANIKDGCRSFRGASPRHDDGISHRLTTGKLEIDLSFPYHEQII